MYSYSKVSHLVVSLIAFAMLSALSLAVATAADDVRAPALVDPPDVTVSADALGVCRDAALVSPGQTRVVRCAVDRLYPWPLQAQVETGSRTLQAWLVRSNGEFVDVAFRTTSTLTERASVRITLTLAVPAGAVSAPVAAVGRSTRAGGVPPALTATAATAGTFATPETTTPAAGTAGV